MGVYAGPEALLPAKVALACPRDQPGARGTRNWRVGCVWKKPLFLHALPSELAAISSADTAIQAKQKLREAGPHRALPPKLHGGLKTSSGREPGLGAAGGRGLRGGKARRTPLPEPRAGSRGRAWPGRPRPGEALPPRGWAGAAPPPCPPLRRPVASFGTGPSPCAWRLSPGGTGAVPVCVAAPRGGGRGGAGSAALPGPAPPPSLLLSLPPSPAPAAPAPRTTAAASRHVGRQAPGP